MGLKLIKAYPAISFLEKFQKHYSSEKQYMNLIEEVILPYISKRQQKMNQPNQVALFIFNVFRGQITDDVLKFFKQNITDTIFVSGNMAGI